MTRARTLRPSLVILAGLLLGAAVGTLGTRAGQALTPASGPPTEAQLTAEYDASMVAIGGHLRPEALSAVTDHTSDGDSLAILAILRGRDLAGCEDLGRQLREVQHRSGSNLVVWTLARDREDAERFLRRERIRAAIVATGSLDDLGLRPVPLVTPAVVRVRLSDGTSEGIGHASRFKNVRSRSFAHEVPRLPVD